MVGLRSNIAAASFNVLYIGSAVPLETAEGLEAIQQPLRERYPANNEKDIEGIDTTVTVVPNFLQMQYVKDPSHVIQFPLGSLNICAAVRCVSTINGATGEQVSRFVSLNNPLAGGNNVKRPAIFTAITRRTQGRKILECHGFICQSPKEALDLVKFTSMAAKNAKQYGTMQTTVPTPRPVSSVSDVIQDANWNFTDETLNRDEEMRHSRRSTLAPHAMRLVPGEPLAQIITPGPEFFEPVSKQGYFYSSDKVEIKKYNIERTSDDADPRPEPEIYGEMPAYPPPGVMTGLPLPGPMFAAPRMPATMMRPMYMGPPQPPRMRPRFFSPPPMRLHRGPLYMPPGGPPPVFAPPIYVRRPRSYSSGSRSASPQPSHLSRQQSIAGRPDDNTDMKGPRGDADSSSDDSIGRPRSPPTDYEYRPRNRMSRRDQYEVRERRWSPPSAYPPPADVIMPPYGYDFRMYPPYNGGYPPFAMHNPHARARSVPAHRHQRSKSPLKKGKKQKKSKKSNQKKRAVGKYPIYRAPSDISTEGVGGYHSEIPRAQPPADVNGSAYRLYPKRDLVHDENLPPRDFRRKENQFMNERNFSKSIHEESRRSVKGEPVDYRTAYELNDDTNRQEPRTKIEEDAGDFTMY